LPLIGFAVAIAAALRPVGNRLNRRAVLAGSFVAGVTVLLAFGAKSAVQVRTWRDSVTTWNHCIAVDPRNARAHDVLADNLVRAGRSKEAIAHYEKALEIRPRSIEALGGLATELVTAAEEKFRDPSRAVELARRACELTNWDDQERRHILAGALSALAYELQQKGEFAQAIQNYEKAMRVDAEAPLPMFNLALLLATCPEQKLRRPETAVQLAEHGHRIAKTRDINSFLILAMVYARTGRFQAAASATETALAMAKDSGNTQGVAALQRQLELYEAIARQKGAR